MSDIPPNIVGSSLQAGFQQAEAARARDAQRAAQAHAARNSAQAIDDAGNTIETDDEDAQVYRDAQGTGGQGRSAEEETRDSNSEEPETGLETGIMPDDDGELHVDLEA